MIKKSTKITNHADPNLIRSPDLQYQEESPVNSAELCRLIDNLEGLF